MSMEDVALAQSNGREPWWARNRDKLFTFAFILLLASVMGLIPSPTSKGMTTLQEEHQVMETTLKVMCIHQAKNDREREDCIRGWVDDAK